jgi:hypothetical protein
MHATQRSLSVPIRDLDRIPDRPGLWSAMAESPGLTLGPATIVKDDGAELAVTIVDVLYLGHGVSCLTLAIR